MSPQQLAMLMQLEVISIDVFGYKYSKVTLILLVQLLDERN